MIFQISLGFGQTFLPFLIILAGILAAVAQAGMECLVSNYQKLTGTNDKTVMNVTKISRTL